MKELWVDAHAPKTIEDYVFTNEDLKLQVKTWVKDKTVPHVLFYGSPGTGKTTLAKILISELGLEDYDVLSANGSKEGRKIEWVDKLINFCQTMPFGPYKVVFIDEADYMNINSTQPALRNLMVEYSQFVRFVMTCNYPNKLMPAIHSRLQSFQIEKADLTDFTARAATVLVTENIEFNLETLDLYIKATYPDLRKCLNLLQSNSVSGKLSAPGESDGAAKEWRLEAVALFAAGDIRKAREIICAQATVEDIDGMFRWMYDNLGIWSKTPEGQDAAILAIRKGMISHGQVADPEINLSATLIELTQLNK